MYKSASKNRNAGTEWWQMKWSGRIAYVWGVHIPRFIFPWVFISHSTEITWYRVKTTTDGTILFWDDIAVVSTYPICSEACSTQTSVIAGHRVEHTNIIKQAEKQNK